MHFGRRNSRYPSSSKAYHDSHLFLSPLSCHFLSGVGEELMEPKVL